MQWFTVILPTSRLPKLLSKQGFPPGNQLIFIFVRFQRNIADLPMSHPFFDDVIR